MLNYKTDLVMFKSYAIIFQQNEFIKWHYSFLISSLLKIFKKKFFFTALAPLVTCFHLSVSVQDVFCCRFFQDSVCFGLFKC